MMRDTDTILQNDEQSFVIDYFTAGSLTWQHSLTASNMNCMSVLTVLEAATDEQSMHHDYNPNGRIHFSK